MQRPARIQWASDINVTASLDALKETIKASLRAIYGGIGTPFVVYNMAGDQGAQTTVQTANAGPLVFSTTLNMHSEMMAIAHMLSSGQWGLAFGQARTNSGAPVPHTAFTTTQPHCGFCTIMLAILQLPLTQPTRGNYNLAVNYNYPLPPSIQTDFYVFVRLVNSGVYRHTFLKQLLNVFFSFPADSWVLQIDPLLIDDNGEVAPENVGRRAVIPYVEIGTHTNSFRVLWSYIWRCLYEINNE